MRRKPLFPPPISAATGKPKRHKGRQKFSLLSINGRLRLWRIRWHCPAEGSETPLDRFLDETEAADTLWRTAHIQISKETLRQLVEEEGRVVLRDMQRGKLSPTWTSADCTTESGASRVYLGCDGVKVPLVTAEEKQKRRRKIRDNRRRRGR